ncbi:MAG: exonuclease domain-containing protein [bacterium]|nr:exonuclease domain-containing protein [bacterium]
MSLPLNTLSLDELYNTSITDLDYTVVDLETTGCKPGVSQIIEIGIVKIKNKQIVDTYQSFLDPGTPIPAFISKMTGIKDSDVQNAPLLPDLAPKILSLLKDTVFVAHNVGFDYSFLQKNLRLCKIDFSSPKLCTVQLSRKLLPQLLHHKLDDLARHFHIEIPSRHRALDDALATGKSLLYMFDILASTNKKVFGMMVDLCMPQESKKYAILKPTIDALPYAPGVYFMKNKDNQIIYVGKSKCLQKRVRSYFYSSDKKTRKLEKLIDSVTAIEHTATGSELSALLLESKKIKEHLPIYNTMIRNYKSYPFLKISNEAFPRIYSVREVKADSATYYGPFKSSSTLDSTILHLQNAFKIRPCKHKINPTKLDTMKLCLYYELGKCPGVCGGKMSQSEYALLIEKAKQFLSGNEQVIISKLQSQIDQMSEKLEFEKAADMRDNVITLERILSKTQTLNNSIKDNNVLIIEEGIHKYTKEVFCIKNGVLYSTLIANKVPLNTTALNSKQAIMTQNKQNYKYSFLHLDDSSLELEEYERYQTRKEKEQTEMWEDTLNAIYSTNQPDTKITKENIDDLMILSTWLMQHNNAKNIYYIKNRDSIKSLSKELTKKYTLQ